MGAAWIAAMVSLAASLATSHAQELKADRPSRYDVQPGDTLWDIAGHFLHDPWRWPAIWKINENIANPHLIYPGDVLVLDFVAGSPQVRVLRSEKVRPTVKLGPKVRTSAFDDAITTIAPSAIQPFLTAPLVIEQGGLDEHPYVAGGVDDNIAFGKLSQIYARGLTDETQEFYQLFRPGGAFVDPETKEVLGHEALYLGEARVLRFGETSKLEIVASREEISLGDRLVESERSVALPYYFPHAPEHEVHGRILRTIGGVAELGTYDIVVLSLGTRDAIEEGHVLRILRHRQRLVDPVTGKRFDPPDENSGLAMVFRSFEKVSYALVLNTTRAIHILDAVTNP